MSTACWLLNYDRWYREQLYNAKCRLEPVTWAESEYYVPYEIPKFKQRTSSGRRYET